MYLPDEKWPWTQVASCVPAKDMTPELNKQIYRKKINKEENTKGHRHKSQSQYYVKLVEIEHEKSTVLLGYKEHMKLNWLGAGKKMLA